VADAKTGDALWKWILGGLAAGAAVLGLLVGAYEIGYDRGQDNAEAAVETRPAEPAETAPPGTEAPPAETTPPATEAPPAETETASEAELVARGEALWTSTGCAGCHSLDGSAGAGPTVQGLAGSTVTLDDGSTVTADDAYLERSITDPDAQISEGYAAGIMAGAVASQDFGTRPDDVDALVAFLEAQA
jgi:mono/diheme cytochrome c family protein